MKYFKPGSRSYLANDNAINDNKINNVNKYKNQQTFSISNAVFKITADIDPDIYNLFIYKDGIEEYYDIAFIPDFNTSVMMNKLFRKIKENYNLDALEESDDEAEFEDSRDDKYVYLERCFKMRCEYNLKFKKWIPISLADKNEKIINYKQLISSNKNY
jgi:hypothetical protein